MFGIEEKNGYRRLIGIIGGTIAGGVAIAWAVPVLRRRALRATTILTKDHRVLSGLFWTLQHTTNASIRKSIFNEIQNQLEIHAQAEQVIFYPAVRNLYTASAERKVDEANREHQQIKDLCHQISTTNPDSFMFMSKVNELQERVKHHVEKEENEIFPLAQNNMSTEELDYLGRRIHDRKVQLKERIAA